MARLRDVPVVLESVGIWGFSKRVWGQVADDSLLTWAAALAYSWLFAIFPFFIFLLTLVPHLPAKAQAAADREIENMLYDNLPEDAADSIWDNLQDNIIGEIAKTKAGFFFRVMGLGLALWAAAGGMAMTMSALDRCYELPIRGGRPFWKQRLIALGLTVIVAVLILLVVILLPVGTIVKNYVVAHEYVQEKSPLLIAFNIVRWALSIFFMIAVLMVLYHYGPSIKHRYRWITPGSVFSITVWIVLGLVFRIYVDRFANYNKTYGTVAGVAVLLLFFYFDAVVLLMGAEINSEIDFEVLRIPRGSRDFRRAEAEKSAESEVTAG